jgi:hypothetical protein
MGDIKLAGEGTFEWDVGGVGSWGGSIGAGYELTNVFHNSFSEGTMEDIDGIAIGMLLVLGFGCTNGPEEGAGSV